MTDILTDIVPANQPQETRGTSVTPLVDSASSPLQPTSRVFQADSRKLTFIEKSSVDLVVTSPPYWQRRDYGHPKQIGNEPTPEAYIRVLVKVLNGLIPLLRPHSSVFLNIADTYRDGFLVGVPAQFEVAARKAGWNIANDIVWTKAIGRPEPVPYRLASRHERIIHLTRAKRAADMYFDLHSLHVDMGETANPGDVWALHPTRNDTDHLAPFPPELARRAILVACPERVCSSCFRPFKRRLANSAILNQSRPQAIRAMELFEQHQLTSDHLAAIRAVGISDAGKGKRVQKGAGRNSKRIQALADEAKALLGGYFREFTFAPKVHIGWDTCNCNAQVSPGTVLDPFMGSGTTLTVATMLHRHSIGVDLVVPTVPGEDR